jgi:hypothetical protein
MIASTPFRMRLTGARKRLDYLATMNPLGEQDAIRWTLELHDACTEAEQHLHYIDASLHTLQRTDPTPADRAREMEIFASSRSEFLKALREIRHLIAQQFPTVLCEH